MDTIIYWFRNDLRLHDNPGLTEAAVLGKNVIPLFIVNPKQMQGTGASANRNRFLIESLHDLRKSLRKSNADLIMRSGNPIDVILQVAKQTHANAVFVSEDITPYSMNRDKEARHRLEEWGIQFRIFPGRFCVDNLRHIQTKSGSPYQIFTPFWRAWLTEVRRSVLTQPKMFRMPRTLDIGVIPTLEEFNKQSRLSPHVISGGESNALKQLRVFLANSANQYKLAQNDLAGDNTSRLSAYLHFGCISPRLIEASLSDSEHEQAFRRQLAWRDFYAYILMHFPKTLKEPFQSKYKLLKWSKDTRLLSAWKAGVTGYPVVDAAMRQLLAEGWMHNRGRLIVGSFLTKDLWLDWKLGAAYFMEMLVDGDLASNTGNWQWIASIGVDPAPIFRRLYNPTSQQKTYDITNEYVRRYVPELRNVPDEYILTPWLMPKTAQISSNCIVGTHYPKPIVEHAKSRLIALQNYRSVYVT